jgi:hypothetical protein
VKVLIVVMRLSYATFSFWSLIIIERILFHLPWQHGIEAIVHPADVRAALLLAAIGMSQIFMAFLMHLLFSFDSDGLINERPPEGGDTRGIQCSAIADAICQDSATPGGWPRSRF